MSFSAASVGDSFVGPTENLISPLLLFLLLLLLLMLLLLLLHLFTDRTTNVNNDICSVGGMCRCDDRYADCQCYLRVYMGIG
eukprot:SAG11_NODE_342_length_10454_cov_11.233079_7_plen_82_part_00